MVYDLWETTINGKKRKILPYGVLLEDFSELPSVFTYFKNEGFSCHWWNIKYKCILINLDLKRYGTISKACQFPMIGGTPMTITNFINQIYKPWKESRGEVFVEYKHDPTFYIENNNFYNGM